jgi:hypothetical protein
MRIVATGPTVGLFMFPIFPAQSALVASESISTRLEGSLINSPTKFITRASYVTIKIVAVAIQKALFYNILRMI